MTHPTPHRDLHSEITDQLVRAIETSPGDFQLPWRRAAGTLHTPINALTGKRYSGVNIISLWVAAVQCEFQTSQWATYRQWSQKGCQVRKGEKASLVVFYKEYETEPDPADVEDTGKRRVARASAVFNVVQVDGYTPPETPADLGPVERIARADAFVKAANADIRHGGDRAFYRASNDYIQMPAESLFTGTATLTRNQGYYATLVHELVHWTSAQHRLNRILGKRFGDMAYAAEELVAEVDGTSGGHVRDRVHPSYLPRSDSAPKTQAFLQIVRLSA